MSAANNYQEEIILTMDNYTQSINFQNHPTVYFLMNLLIECYNKTNKTHSKIVEKNYNKDGPWCKRKFDGWVCWDETPASTNAYQHCPGYVVGFDPNLYVYKSCTENGSWLKPPTFNNTWTNYTTCVNYPDLGFRTTVNNIYVTGYTMSMIALIVAIMIFCYFRNLQCMRIRVHKQMFSSFVLSNVFWILWYRAVVERADVVGENVPWCQGLHIVTNYLMTTNYIWMFCESLHLHIALVLVFIKEELAMRCFMALGWGLSFVIILIYALVRNYAIGDTARCWMDNSDAAWIIIVPVGLSLFTSFLFLVNVVRILVLKLRPIQNQGMCDAVKKAARAALILIPLFGLHFIIMPLHPQMGTPGENIYQVVSALITSLQGLCVSVLYCFTNSEVIAAIKIYLSRFQRRNEAIAMTGDTAEESLNKRDNHELVPITDSS